MQECGIITQRLYDQLKGIGGLRNVLVHRYLRVDTTQVYEHTQEAPHVFESFSEEILAWLDVSG